MVEYKLSELKIEVTYECPLVCIHCSSDSSPSALPQISPDKCFSILSEATQMGVSKVAFSGGEPLLYKGIIDITRYALEKGMQPTIYTSGNVVEIEKILSDLKSVGLHSLAFSLFAASEKEHELITRKKGSFNNTLKAIKQAQQLGIESEIHFVALKRNYRFLNDVVSLASSLQVKKVSVLRFVPQGRGHLINNQILNREEFINLKNNIEKIRKSNFNIRTGSPLNFLFVNDSPVCNSGLTRLLISADLNISPCDAFKQVNANEIAGSSDFSNLENHTLSECWEKSPYLNSIRSFLKSEFKRPCSVCDDLGKCLSGCLAQKVIQYGKLIKKPDPSCLNSNDNV